MTTKTTIHSPPLKRKGQNRPLPQQGHFRSHQSRNRQLPHLQPQYPIRLSMDPIPNRRATHLSQSVVPKTSQRAIHQARNQFPTGPSMPPRKSMEELHLFEKGRTSMVVHRGEDHQSHRRRTVRHPLRRTSPNDGRLLSLEERASQSYHRPIDGISHHVLELPRGMDQWHLVHAGWRRHGMSGSLEPPDILRYE